MEPSPKMKCARRDQNPETLPRKATALKAHRRTMAEMTDHSPKARHPKRID